jgi:Phosphotransferase enzyme family
MDGPDRSRLLAQQAEQLVRRYRGRQISLRDPMVVAVRERSLVVRCAVTGWDSVASVVLKRNEGDDERGFTDWASLAFLSTLEEATGVAPHLYAGNVRERFFVMEDLGGSRSLADLLDNGDAATVVEALGTLATSMARLVVATSGREEIFERMRATLPGGASLGRWREAARWLEARKRVARWAAALDISLPHGFDVACAHIAAVYADPGPYLAFSHGDPAPSNNHIATGGVRLVDFEYAGYRHALYDITAWDTLCPLPKEWMAAMEQVFRRAVGTSPLGGSLVDDDQYREAWATMCAYRALAMVTWFSPDLLAQDRPWTPGWTRRAALISTTLRLHQASAGVAALEPLAELGGHMSEELRARWPELGDGALHWPGVDGAP